MSLYKSDIIEDLAPEWTVGADGVLTCPCGHRVEDDGKCPNGHVSPLREVGMI